ncbi:MAG: hypothetical protein QXX33_04710 [Candidatus Hadarchaeales archaeon]
MLSTPTDLLAAGFAVAGFTIFMLVCSNAMKASERKSELEVALDLSRGFVTLSMYSTEESIEWLKNQKEFFEHSGMEIKMEIVDSRGEILFSLGEGCPRNYSKIVLFCAWPKQDFPQDSVLSCYVWRK